MSAPWTVVRTAVVIAAALVAVSPAAGGSVTGPDGAWAADASALAAKHKPPLRRRRRLPAGVRGQLRGLVGVGDPPQCMSTGPAPAPTLTTWSYASSLEVRHGGRVAPAERLFVCAYGFASKRSSPAIVVRFERPDGRVVIRRWRSLKPFDWAMGDWIALPSHPLGTYTVTATQGQRSASTNFMIVPPDRPRLFVLDPQGSFTPHQILGRPLSIVLAGVKARSRVWLDFYRTDGLDVPEIPRFDYLTSIRVRVDRHGVLRYRLRTARTDRQAIYQVALRRGRRVYDGGCFTLTRRERSGLCASG